jgi:thymidylate synthase (FAD)
MEIDTPDLLTPQFYMVSHTLPTAELADKGVTTALELVAYCARVSNPANQLNASTAAKLIRSLLKRKEWSPLEMIDVTFGITTARDISRQILRHRSFTFQEFSQRYADVGDDRHCLREARIEHPTDRQSSILCEDPAIVDRWILYQLEVLEMSRRAYNWARKHKIAKECARVVLPEGLTLTDLYMKGSVRSWIHYLELRQSNGTQLEHQQIALGLATALAAVFPVGDVLS